MIKRSYSLISPVTLGLVAGIGLSGVQLNAQQQTDPHQAPTPYQQQIAPDSQSARHRPAGFGEVTRRKEGPNQRDPRSGRQDDPRKVT